MSASVGTSIVSLLVLNVPRVAGDRVVVPRPDLAMDPAAAVASQIPGSGIPALPALDLPRYWGGDHVPDAGYRQLLSNAASESSLSEPTALETQRSQAADALLAFDEGVQSHSMRVALLARAIARQLGLSDAQARDVAWGAMVHDVGKSDPRILGLVNLPGSLTASQHKVVEAHTTLGAQRLLRREDLDSGSRFEAAAVALFHHETMDGKGYPHGLRGTQIPLAARIVHVADFYDALVEHRPYRRAVSHDEALALMRESSRGFDPDVWSAFLDVIAPAPQ